MIIITKDKEKAEIDKSDYVCLRSPYSYLSQDPLYKVNTMEDFKMHQLGYFQMITMFSCDPIITSLRELYKRQKDYDLFVYCENEEREYIVQLIIDFFSKF